MFADRARIYVRSGNHCAKILLNVIGVSETIRASLYLYNTKEEIDYLIEVLKGVTLQKCIEAGTILVPASKADKDIQDAEDQAGSMKDQAEAKKKNTAKKPVVKEKVQPKQETVENDTLRDEVRIVFKKALTDREQKVFDHFAQNSGKIVYAKDLAALLDLPRDYVYKYIKNLRAKIDGDNLQNADKGGFILHV